MTVYTSSAASPIANDGGGKFYTTFFFINGPYNPNINTVSQHERALDDAILPSVPLRRSERSQQHHRTSRRSSSRDGLACVEGEEHLSPFFLIDC